MKNCEVYNLTKRTPISETIARSQKTHLGHILKRRTPTRDILEYVLTAPPVKPLKETIKHPEHHKDVQQGSRQKRIQVLVHDGIGETVVTIRSCFELNWLSKTKTGSILFWPHPRLSGLK